jgi:hypothetical protein
MGPSRRPGFPSYSLGLNGMSRVLHTLRATMGELRGRGAGHYV